VKARAVFALTALLALAVCASARAQTTEAGRLIAAARAQLDEANVDSAAALLGLALDPGRGATGEEQTRAWMYYALVQIIRENMPSARDAIRQALRRNGQLRVDSLSYFHDALVREFETERAAMGLVVAPAAAAPAALAVQIDSPGDTAVPADSGRYRIQTTPNRPARVITQLYPADVPGNILWADTQAVQGVATRAWNLRDRSGALVAPGRYTLAVLAIDSLNQISPTIARFLVVERVSVDTAPHPPPLTASAFQPETLRLRRGSPAVLAVGLGVGLMAAAMPTALGNADLNSGRAGDGTSMAVAAVASVAGVMGYVSGQRVRYSAENARANAALRQRHEEQRTAVIRQNRATIDNAPVRVRVEQ
jgi:hypothetical protein